MNKNDKEIMLMFYEEYIDEVYGIECKDKLKVGAVQDWFAQRYKDEQASEVVHVWTSRMTGDIEE